MTGRQEKLPEEVTWAAPPDKTFAPPERYVALLEQVKSKPGSWAIIRESQVSPRVSTDKRKLQGSSGVSDEHWEFRTARIESGENEGMWALYARYRTREQLEQARKTRKRR